MKFKVYKLGAAQFVEKLPINDLSFQIKLKGGIEGHLKKQDKPNLEQVLNEYRKMNANNQLSKNIRREQMRRSIVSHSGDMNIKLMKDTTQKIGKKATERR